MVQMPVWCVVAVILVLVLLHVADWASRWKAGQRIAELVKLNASLTAELDATASVRELLANPMQLLVDNEKLRPTIEELDAMLANPSPGKVVTLPNGEVHVVHKRPDSVTRAILEGDMSELGVDLGAKCTCDGPCSRHPWRQAKRFPFFQKPMDYPDSEDPRT